MNGSRRRRSSQSRQDRTQADIPAGWKMPDQSLFHRIVATYNGSDGDATRALYGELQGHGPAGVMAMNLFRACKCSARAKVYRGGGYTGMAYDRKAWSMGLLCDELGRHADLLGIAWGWGLDPRAVGFENVLYIELPDGQVSFHSDVRKAGPAYSGKWDGASGMSPARILRFCYRVLAGDLAAKNVAENILKKEPQEAISIG